MTVKGTNERWRGAVGLSAWDVFNLRVRFAWKFRKLDWKARYARATGAEAIAFAAGAETAQWAYLQLTAKYNRAARKQQKKQLT